MLREALAEEYQQQTEHSHGLHAQACEYFPGGITRGINHFQPYPSYVNSASGCTLETVDDEQLLDLVNNYTQTVLGHAPPAVVERVCDRFAMGNGLAAPTNDAISLAEILWTRVDSIDKLRFANSGTEATMNAIRAAIAFTGREKILKVYRGYHGSHDMVEFGVTQQGRENPGIPSLLEQQVVLSRFNNTESLKETIESHGSDLACFIVEPVLGAGGVIPGTDEYLATARDLTDSHDILLIFDEVISFRLAEGGAQAMYGIEPDLTALGKLIGGGLPIGAFGGRADIMEVFHPEDGSVDHSGTFIANPATMVGGCATLENFGADEIEQINALGAQLRERLRDIAAESPIPITVTGIGSLFNVHFTDQEVTGEQLSIGDKELSYALFMGMRNQGVYLAPRGLGSISTPMGQAEVDAVAESFQAALSRIEAEFPLDTVPGQD